MTVLLELKERLKLIYSKGDAFIVPIAKFLLAFITLNTLNGRMGYMTRIDDVRIVLIAGLACSFLPVGALVLFAALFSLMHMYALSMEVALVGLSVYLIMYLLFFRFSPKDSLVVVLTPLLFALKMQYVIPLAVGLVCGPSSIVSVGCGVVVFYLMELVMDIAPNIKTMGEEDALGKIRMMVESILNNKVMLVMIAAFAVTILAVYLIRRMSVDYSWTIAMVAGAMINVVILLVGDLLYDINISVGGALLGAIVSLAVAKVIEFFRFCVDYSRTERVQFEDDEYYYYVKAVPKMTVPVSTKTVKKINLQREKESDAAPRAGSSGRSSFRRSGGQTTQRTAATGDRRGSASQAQRRGNERINRKSVTIGNTSGKKSVTDSKEELTDDYEEWQ